MVHGSSGLRALVCAFLLLAGVLAEPPPIAPTTDEPADAQYQLSTSILPDTNLNLGLLNTQTVGFHPPRSDPTVAGT